MDTEPSVSYADMIAPYRHGRTGFWSESLPSAAGSARRKTRLLEDAVRWYSLDRVNVLGDEEHGHTGCINALSWARDGELLLSGGDDATVRVWRLDPSQTEQAYPYTCQTVIRTSHKYNIFNAQMLPFSSRIATVAGDGLVKVFDVGESVGYSPDGQEAVYNTRDALVKRLRCHDARTKRIVTEESPDLFMTVSEDGTVRQHDLRTSHNCSDETCPAPLVKLPFDLSSLSLSPLTPYQFVVAGGSPYGYLFDRRHAARFLQAEWGVPPSARALTTCVRRLGRAPREAGTRRREHAHITGTRMSSCNGHEVLLSYSGDAVYLYSTLDSPEDEDSIAGLQQGGILSPNRKTGSSTKPGDVEMSSADESTDTSSHDMPMSQDEFDDMVVELQQAYDDRVSESADIEFEDEDEDDDASEKMFSEIDNGVPLLLPRRRFEGAGNVETVKDVNFLGPRDEYIASGSDDGNFFLWRKASGQLHGIWEGDGSVVNVIEGHPRMPLIAVSGIDYTIKLFSPVSGPSTFSRMDCADGIMRQNRTSSSHGGGRDVELAFLYRQYGMALRTVAGQENGDEQGVIQCPTQ